MRWACAFSMREKVSITMRHSRTLKKPRTVTSGQAWNRNGKPLAGKIRQGHHRKHSFIGGFERLVAGRGSSKEPSFLARARSRWSPRVPKSSQVPSLGDSWLDLRGLTTVQVGMISSHAHIRNALNIASVSYTYFGTRENLSEYAHDPFALWAVVLPSR